MPGKILDVKVAAGAAVKRGEVIAILEAMKMENEIVAPQDGTIASIETSKGAAVETGAVLATMNWDSDPDRKYNDEEIRTWI